MDAEHLRELFAEFGPVSVKRMFGGAAIGADGVTIAIVAGGLIYFKADEQSAAAFDREGLPPFSFARAGGETIMTSYRRMPDRLYDDPEELALWARAALAAARRAASAKRKIKTPRRSGQAFTRTGRSRKAGR